MLDGDVVQKRDVGRGRAPVRNPRAPPRLGPRPAVPDAPTRRSRRRSCAPGTSVEARSRSDGGPPTCDAAGQPVPRSKPEVPPCPGGSVRGRLITTVAVVALVAAVAWLGVPLILKPPTGRTQARLAQHEPLWKLQPPELREASRFVSIADAGWLPWADRATVVGRHYALKPTDELVS